MGIRNIRPYLNHKVAGGRAYGIFKSACGESGIKDALGKARPDWKPEPEPLISAKNRFGVFELSDVKQGAWIIKGDEEQMVAAARQWRGQGANSFIRITIADVTNKKTAEELQALLAALHSGPFPVIEKIGNATAAVYFREDSGAYTCRIIGG